MNRNKLVTYALVLAASFLTFVGLSSSRAYSQGNGAATLQNQPFSFDVSPACNGDDVSITGKLSLVEHDFTSTDGTEHFQIRETLHGTGIGSPSGQNYIFNATASDEANVSNSDTGEETEVPIKFELIAQGGGQNFYVTVFFHVTVDANGNLRVDIQRVEMNCHG
ncbi:MAG TPA: hypothetical protein VNM47_00285 [Terriglobia bacterium]|nr:hypothetical protein [Terriglobia bacterium]